MISKEHFQRCELFNLILISVGAISTFIIYLGCRHFKLQLLFAPILILILFFLINYKYRVKNKDGLLKYLLSGSIIFLTFHFSYTISTSYLRIPQWDYMAFYLYSVAGQSGGNFYDPDLFKELFNSLKLRPLTTPVFMEEVVNVGFPYPPPAMIILFPLGWFDLKTGYFIWQSILIIFLIASIYFLLDIFSIKNKIRHQKILYTLILAHLILLFPGITSSVSYAQTNPILLFFLLLSLKRMDHWDAGIYLTIMIMIKPLAGLFALYFLMERKWNVIAAAIASGIVILIITGVMFDFNMFVQFFTSPPTDRLPGFVYSEPVNKSLSAVLLRLHFNHLIFPDQSAVKTLTLIISAILLVITVLLSWRLSNKSPHLSFLIFIPFALIVYPASLAHYSLLLVPVILAIFQKEYKNIGKPGFIGFLMSLYIIAFYHMFFLNIFLLLYYAYLSKNLKTKTHVIRNQFSM